MTDHERLLVALSSAPETPETVVDALALCELMSLLRDLGPNLQPVALA
jgi:hypothetical protein